MLLAAPYQTAATGDSNKNSSKPARRRIAIGSTLASTFLLRSRSSVPSSPEGRNPNPISPPSRHHSTNSSNNLNSNVVATTLRRIRSNDATLRKVDCGSWNVDDRTIAALAQALPLTNHLRQLRLHHHRLTPRGVRVLAQGLDRNRSLLSVTGLQQQQQGSAIEIDQCILADIKFYLRRNQMEQACHCAVVQQSAAAAALVRSEEAAIVAAPPQEMSPDNFSIAAPPQHTAATKQRRSSWVPPSLLKICHNLEHAYETRHVVTELNLEWHSIDDAGAEALGNALRHSPCLRRMALDYNQIRNFGAAAIARGARSCPDLHELSLRHNPIGDAGVMALLKLSQLRKLLLNQTEMGPLACRAIAHALCPHQYESRNAIALPYLELLDVSGNVAIGDAMTEIATALRFNHTLRVLAAEGCNVEDSGCDALAQSLPRNQLSALHLGRNHIGDAGAIALSQVLQEQVHLQALVLCGNVIGLNGADALAIAVCENEKIIELDLADNALIQANDPSFLRNIHQVLMRNRDKAQQRLLPCDDDAKSLMRFSRDDNNDEVLPALVASPKRSASSVTSDAASDLTSDSEDEHDIEVDHHHPKWPNLYSLQQRLMNNDLDLTLLHLDSAGLGDMEIAQLGRCLLSNSSLTELRLVDNCITARGVTSLCVSLKMNSHSAIERLNLSSNAIGDAGAMAIADLIGSSRHPNKSSTLKTLWLFSTGMGDAGASALATVLRTNPVEELYLQQNHIGPDGAAALASTLSQDHVLRVLNLHNNRIGDKGVITITKEGLIQNDACVLEQLILSSNDLGNDAAIALGAYLGWNPALRLLDLSQNQIGDAGLKILSMGLTQNFRISYLNLAENHISDAGCGSLAKALEMNSSLDTISLDRNERLTKKSVLAMARALERNHSLLVVAGLPLTNNDDDCNENVTKILEAMLKRNRREDRNHSR